MRKRALFIGLASTAAVAAFAFASGYPGGAVVYGPDLVTGRMGHKIATLPDGDVLVVGGHGPGFVSLSTAELWSPQTNAWSQIAASPDPLDGCAIVRLTNGKYLIAGGADDEGSTPGYNAASIFNPTTKTFSQTSSMTYRRFQCSGAQLAGGNVLIVGGWYGGGGPALYGEIYDTGTMSFSHTTHEMNIQRAGPLVVPCGDGTAFVVGGYPPLGGAAFESVESYDPATDTFSVASGQILPGQSGWLVYPSNAAPRAIEDQRAPDGTFLLLGYRSAGADVEQTLFTIDPATKTFSPFTTTPTLPTQAASVFSQHPVIDYARGLAYLVGKVPGTSADFAVYAVDLSTHELTVPPGSYHLPNSYYPDNAAATVLSDGRLLLTGGMGDTTDYAAIATTLFVTPGGVAPANQPPILDDQPSSSGVLVAAGETVHFHVAAHDPDGDQISIYWDFGDGQGVDGANPSHVYGALGPHHVVVTVSDGDLAVTGAFDLVVGDPFVLPAVSANLNFKHPGRDVLTFRGRLTLPVGFAPLGVAVAFEAGGVRKSFVLNRKGKAKTADGSVSLTYVKKKRLWSLSVGLAKGDFAPTWQDEGFVDQTVKKVPVTIKVTAEIGGVAKCAHLVQELYTAKHGNWGRVR